MAGIKLTVQRVTENESATQIIRRLFRARGEQQDQKMAASRDAAFACEDALHVFPCRG